MGVGGLYYRYIGKELNEELGLDLAIYTSYDPAIGIWLQIDPIYEKYYGLTPYNGMGNNPIILSDPNRDTLRVNVFDQSTRPQDNGATGTFYTADIYIYDDETGDVYGP